MSDLGVIATNAVGGLFGIQATKINNQMAAEREKIARQENYKYNERAAEAADARTRALYADLQSPEAMLAQYRAAGLSPSQMFSGGAQGAQPSNGAQGAGPQGISPNVFGYDPMMLANVGLINAQARNQEAQADKAQTEADTIAGKNERGKEEIVNLKSQTAVNNQRLGEIYANAKLKGLQSVFQEFANSIEMLQMSYDASTLEKRIQYFGKQCEYLEYQTRSEKVKAEVGEQTQKEAIKLIQWNVKNTIADTMKKLAEAELADKQKKLTDEQVNDLISQIETRGKQVEINRDTLKQTINEWALANGLVGTGDIDFGDIVLKRLAGDKAEGKNADAIGTLITLIKLFAK